MHLKEAALSGNTPKKNCSGTLPGTSNTPYSKSLKVTQIDCNYRNLLY